jgi:hypothetical protein
LDLLPGQRVAASDLELREPAAGEPPAAINTTYGSAWLKPLNILQARYVKFGAQLTF